MGVNGIESVKALVNAEGADVSVLDRNGRTPLHIASSLTSSVASRVVGLLLTAAVSVSAQDKYVLRRCILQLV